MSIEIDFCPLEFYLLRFLHSWSRWQLYFLSIWITSSLSSLTLIPLFHLIMCLFFYIFSIFSSQKFLAINNKFAHFAHWSKNLGCATGLNVIQNSLMRVNGIKKLTNTYRILDQIINKHRWGQKIDETAWKKMTIHWWKPITVENRGSCVKTVRNHRWALMLSNYELSCMKNNTKHPW